MSEPTQRKEWSDEQRIAMRQIDAHLNKLSPGVSIDTKVLGTYAVALQCELNEARELLEGYKEYMWGHHDHCKSVDDWLERNKESK